LWYIINNVYKKKIPLKPSNNSKSQSTSSFQEF